MSKSYIIEWKSQVNGRTGRGTKRFDLGEARHLAEELNREYPEIHHEPVAADSAGESVEAPVSAGDLDEADVAPGVPQLNHSPDHAFSFE